MEPILLGSFPARLTSHVAKTDIAADNGVIHVIDTVLMPKM